MTRQLLTLLAILPLQLGCGSTWGRSSAVEVPLHRSVWGLEPKGPRCTLKEEEWKKRCTREHYGQFDICPQGCPLAEPETLLEEED
ncbi:hypothetical protein [Archangium violaceum]|uniref:Uncharacterized protein n=1 Tax=Archangium violaceum Cb vi76 TaxID=1406225 RepID=A0A084SPY4_9BACT|nr:hypothetical protein [Archangium violaceum]KFA90519.1 hypothetical protein Q664_27905 [Archangium violaceum Cb vi76]